MAQVFPLTSQEIDTQYLYDKNDSLCAIQYGLRDDIVEWLDKNTSRSNWSIRVFDRSEGYIAFENEKAAALYKLRWT